MWILKDAPEGDPLDELGVRGVNLAVDSDEYYALKILRHFRRFEALLKEGRGESTGAWRELILFGETWAQAKAIMNYGREAITGKKQHAYLSKLRAQKNSRAREAAKSRQAIIKSLCGESNRTSGAQTEWLCLTLRTDHGISVSKRTIERDLKKIHGDN